MYRHYNIMFPTFEYGSGLGAGFVGCVSFGGFGVYSLDCMVLGLLMLGVRFGYWTVLSLVCF